MAKFERFDSWIVKDIRLWSLIVKTELRQELDGQKWTFSLDILYL
jgi:hypothetical protein